MAGGCIPRRSVSREQGECGEFADEVDGFKADGDDLADEADDVLGIVLAVGVVDNAGTLGAKRSPVEESNQSFLNIFGLFRLALPYNQ